MTSDAEHEAYKRKVAARSARRLIADTIRQLDAGLTKLWKKELAERIPELLVHAQQGRGFKIHIEVVQADGTPYEIDPLAPKIVEPERTLILLSDR